MLLYFFGVPKFEFEVYIALSGPGKTITLKNRTENNAQREKSNHG